MQTILTTESAKHFEIFSGKIQIGKYLGGEIALSVKENLKSADVFIVASTNAPAENLLELLFTLDTATRLGAARIFLIIPYFGYSRADKEKFPGESISAATVAKLISAVGQKISKIYTLDVHSDRIKGFFQIPFENIETSGLFVHKFLNMMELTVVAPDAGAQKRAMETAKKINTGWAVINKERDEKGNVSIQSIEGDVTRRVFLFDDIIDSGATLLKAADFLKKMGVEEIFVAATHTVWQGGGYKLLAGSNLITRVYTTDTIAPPPDVPEKIEIIPVTPILQKIFDGMKMTIV